MTSENLSRMGVAKVHPGVDEKGGRVIDKYPVNLVEYSFYTSAADELKSIGIKTPRLLHADAEQSRLRLEYIPHKVSQDEVSEDEVLLMLSRLHCYQPKPAWVYHHHGWTDSDLEKSLALLRLPDRAAQQMRFLQQASDALFSQQYLLSGDTNAGNWGRRDNGDLVLFDWERFGTGSPAIDLAPLVKGMGSKKTITKIAERYSALSPVTTTTQLAAEIIIAKAWIVTEVIVLLNERRKNDFEFYLNWYRDKLADWLNEAVQFFTITKNALDE